MPSNDLLLAARCGELDELKQALSGLRIFVLQSKINKEDPVKALDEVNKRLQGMEI